MAVTVASDYKFEPKTWSDHTKAYFDTVLVYGSFAVRNRSLKAEGTGETVNFPYYQSIGPAQEPKEDEALLVDNLTDDSFQATVREAGKAIGATQKSFMSSAATEEDNVEEMLRQLGRVLAEQVDGRLNGEITSYGGNSDPGHAIQLDGEDYNNMAIGYKAAAAGDTMNVKNLLIAKKRAFGDKNRQAIVCFMHTLQMLDLMTNNEQGFLKADANDPYSYLDGFSGRLLGMAIIEVDSVPKVGTQVANTDAYLCHLHKVNSYGIIEKADVNIEGDKDILSRKKLWASTLWYGVKSFDRKTSDLDNKAAGLITTVSTTLARGGVA